MGIPFNRELRVDYIDGNKLNNQKSNLRIASINQINYGATSPTNKNKITSKYIGVSYKLDTERKSFDKRRGKYYIRKERSVWRANVTEDYKQYEKSFPYTDEGEIQAAKWYDSMARILHGKFAVLNFPREKKLEDGGLVEKLTTQQVEQQLNRKLHWWNDDIVSINGIEYKKVFLKNEYKKV
jgi:hypothetical protein